MRKYCWIVLSLLTSFASIGYVRAASEIVCPCQYESNGPTSAIITAGIRNIGASATGDLRIRAYAQTDPASFSDAQMVSVVYYAANLAVDSSRPVTAEKVAFVAPTDGQYETILYLEEESNGNWVLQDTVRMQSQLVLDTVGGSSSGDSGEDTFASIFLDGNATVSVSGDSVTIELPAIQNISSTLTTGNLSVHLAFYDGPRLFGQSFLAAAESDLSLTLAPFSSVAAQTIVTDFEASQLAGFDYLHLTVKDDSKNFPVMAWQNVDAPDGEEVVARNFSVDSIDTLTDSDSDGVSDFNEVLKNTDPSDANSKPGASTLDVLALYSPGVSAIYSGEPEARIIQEIEFGNLVLANSAVDLSLRLVHVQNLDYDENTDIFDVFTEMQSQTGEFEGLDLLRESVGADLVVFFRPPLDSESVCGLGTLGGFVSEGDFAMTTRAEVVTVVSADCRDRTMIHEFGHNMGLAHSVRDSTSKLGTFPWSRGHGVDDLFCTTMSDFRNFPNCTDVLFFSNPQVTCEGSPCGVDRSDTDNGADAAMSLNIVRFQVADYSADAPDTDGDGVINYSDTDDDGDTVADTSDNCPLTSNADQLDTDGDNLGNVCDDDDDGDGIADVDDSSPLGTTDDADGDGISNDIDEDDDNDGIPDAVELSLGLNPLDPNDVTGSPREIMWRHSTLGQNVLWSMESQHRVERNSINSVADTNWQVVGMADFDSDSVDEIFFRHKTTGANRLWSIEDGKRTLSSAVVSASPEWSIVALGDFDADGDADLMWRNANNGTNRYWDMNGNSRLSSLAVRTVALNWNVVGTGDFDNDGRNDLIWRSDGGSNVIWLMQAQTRVARGELPGVGSPWQVSGIGDFDGDGMDDMFWHNPSTGANSLWLLDGASRKSRASIPGVGSGWQPFGVFDMNGDNMADIMWRNTSNGSNRLWLMNGTTRTSSVAIQGVSDQNWVPVAVGNTSN